MPDEAPPPIKETEQDRLLRELTDTRANHKRRQAIGERLSEIGDPRPGVGVDKDGTPEIVWVAVTPGGHIKLPIETWLGVISEEQTFSVQPFYISKYLITYTQYEAFVKAPDGFNNPEWWKRMPSEYQKQELREQRTKLWNSPRDRVSWYQSVAFARWLNHRLGGQELPKPGGSGPALKIGQNAEVCLPLEWQWQWVAQGGRQGREYSWGEWKEGYANTDEAKLGQTIAVGMYPQGATICGAEDMNGQLWEWCQNEYSDPKIVLVNNSTNNRVLRGGSFYLSAHFAACAFRGVSHPFDDFNDCGFRLVVSSPIAPSDL